MPVGRLVAAQPNRSRLFEELGIDYCCGGKQPLQDACASKGLAPEQVIARLEALAPPAAGPAGIDYARMPTDELIDDIISRHHDYLRREMPRLQQLAEKVARVHGGTDARLIEVAGVFDGFVQELTSHMMKEEMILFPAIRQLAAAAAAGGPVFGSVEGPIRVMEAEHDQAGDALQRMRELTDSFTPPDWACNTYRALLDGLTELEQDLHQHIHKENNILFPRALALGENAA